MRVRCWLLVIFSPFAEERGTGGLEAEFPVLRRALARSLVSARLEIEETSQIPGNGIERHERRSFFLESVGVLQRRPFFARG